MPVMRLRPSGGRRGITFQLSVWFLLVGLLPLGCGGYVIYSLARDQMRREVVGQLEALADVRAHRIGGFFKNRVRDAKSLSGMPGIREAMGRLRAAELQYGIGTPEFARADSASRAYLESYVIASPFYDLFLITPGSRIVFSVMQESDYGQDLAGDPYRDTQFFQVFNRVRDRLEAGMSKYAYYPPSRAPAAFAAAPIPGADGALAGVLALQLDAGEIFELVSDYRGLGQTGETLVGFREAQEVVFLTPTRFDSTAAFQRRVPLGAVQAEPLQEAVQGRSGSGLTVDYRGTRILAAWRYIPELDWGIVVKIDAEEAFAPVTELRNAILGFSGGFLVLLVGGILVLARWISGPVTALRESEARLSLALEAARMGTWESEVGEGRVVWSPSTEALFGVNPGAFAGTREAFYEYVHPQDRDRVRAAVERAAKGEDFDVEYRVVRQDGTIRWIANKGRMSGDGKRMLGTAMDITRSKEALEELERHREELERSNRELQQFAYVASHDLQEPLRMVSSYVQLLERRYKDRLDQDAHEFIGYAVDGAARMQTLINDLLAYSRVSTRGKEFAPVDCEAVFSRILRNLQIAIEETGAQVTHDALPTVSGDEGQLVQVFQNLVGNAVKFHGEEIPKVHVSARAEEEEWVFSVQDNGIGIEAGQKERVFVIFQRLHTREQYGGTGIGLSICKRIVERHGGRIWFESEPGKRTTFYFTLPEYSD